MGVKRIPNLTEIIDLSPYDPPVAAELESLFSRVQELMSTAPVDEDAEQAWDYHVSLELDELPANPEEPLHQVVQALRAQLPERWESLVFQADVAADDVRTLTHVWMPAGGDPKGTYQWYFISDLDETIMALRRQMYEPDGRGAWYSMLMRLFRDGSLNVVHNYLVPPFGVWGPHERELLIRDHELFPRDPGHLPHWHPCR